MSNSVVNYISESSQFFLDTVMIVQTLHLSTTSFARVTVRLNIMVVGGRCGGECRC
jgi:hypothetical protein